MRAVALFVFLLLALAARPADAQPATTLDARGREIYDLLMTYPPSREGDLSFIQLHSFEFLRASGRPRFKKQKRSEALAEVIYEFKPFKDSTQNKVMFLIYPDRASAIRYLDAPVPATNFALDGPNGSFRRVAAPPDPLFKRPQKYIFGYTEDVRTAYIRWAYQIDRIVIVGMTNIEAPAQLDVLKPDLDKAPDELFDWGNHLAAIGLATVLQKQFSIADD